MSNWAQIVIDADVIIHFIKGEQLRLLSKIFPQYQLVILEMLLDKELRVRKSTRDYLDDFIRNNPDQILIIHWEPTYEMIKELTALEGRLGFGESISLVYCKFNHNVIASSNIKDIIDYCNLNGIQYITTMDFIWRAYTSKLMTEEECNRFLKLVVDKGSKLPVTRIKEFVPRQLFL